MILVSGALGFIGSHTVRALIEAGQQVVAARHQNATVPPFLAGYVGKSLFVEPLDVCSIEAVRTLAARYTITSVLHLAAPPLGALGAAEEFQLNMQGLINVLQTAHERRMKRVSLASSIAVYAGVPKGPYREEEPLRMSPASSTEAYKKAYEILGQHLAGQLGLEVLLLRIGHIYGPGYRSLANLPSRLVHAAARGVAGPLPRAGAPEPFLEDGGDFCYVKDCAQGIKRLHLAERLSARTYNIGSGRLSRFGEFARAVQALEPAVSINIAPGRNPTQGEPAMMDISRARADVGYSPQFGPDAGIRDYLAWLAAGHER